jgi:sirohydrochlorin ferrochelatase
MIRRTRRERDPYATVIAALDVPDPFDLDELLRRVAAKRGRPIELRPLRTSVGAACGFWVATRSVDYICYEEDTSRLHQEHIVLHELGHIVCGHRQRDDAVALLARVLLPNLDPEVVRRVLSRTVYSHPDEEQAELFATVVLGRSGRFRARVDTASAEVSALLERIERSMGT